MSQQFQDAEFPTLSGCRVVRIATHPELTRAGYGTRALALLTKYYEGEIADLAEEDAVDTGYEPEVALPSVDVEGDLLQETLAVRVFCASLKLARLEIGVIVHGLKYRQDKHTQTVNMCVWSRGAVGGSHHMSSRREHPLVLLPQRMMYWIQIHRPLKAHQNDVTHWVASWFSPPSLN